MPKKFPLDRRASTEQHVVLAIIGHCGMIARILAFSLAFSLIFTVIYSSVMGRPIESGIFTALVAAISGALGTALGYIGGLLSNAFGVKNLGAGTPGNPLTVATGSEPLDVKEKEDTDPENPDAPTSEKESKQD